MCPLGRFFVRSRNFVFLNIRFFIRKLYDLDKKILTQKCAKICEALFLKIQTKISSRSSLWLTVTHKVIDEVLNNLSDPHLNL